MNNHLLWLIKKDLVSEWRAWSVWPETLLLGAMAAVLFGLQIELPREQQRDTFGVILWFSILFAGLPTLDRAFSTQRQDGCLDGILLSPARPSTIFLAKFVVNFLALTLLSSLQVPLWVVLSRSPAVPNPMALVAVVSLGNLGLSAIGTTLGALVGMRGARRGGLLLLLFPLVMPLLVAASESTRLLLHAQFDHEWWRWVHFLAAFAAIFLTAGTVLFEFIVKD